MLSFSEWDKRYYSIDESLGDDVQNWLSKNFGGKISKIDGILSDLVYAEKTYAKEWEKSQREISSMEDQIKTGEISPEEKKSFQSKIKEKREEIEIADRKRIQKIRALNDQARKTMEGNSRVAKYWDLKKAEAEVEVVENLYRVSQSLPNKGVEDKFYKEYLKAQEELKRRRKGIEKLSDDIDKGKVKVKPKEEEKGEVKEITRIGRLISMSIPEFKDEIKKYSPSQIREVRKALIERKNMGLNELRSLRRDKNKELDKSSSKDRKEVLSKYNPKIYEIGEIIDAIREKINHLDD